MLLIALVGEMYLRLVNPFIEGNIPHRFVDGVGLIREPNAELRFADWHGENWNVSRTNSQGFLDREPISAERAAAGCHIAFIGDSFVEAMEDPIADKFHVRLEETAARELPHLDITTQAYGVYGTGQINQLPFYDEYARRLNPKLLVLVFYLNDFSNNSSALQSLILGVDPDRMPFMSAQRDATGAPELRPPDPEYSRFLLPRLPSPWHQRIWVWNRLVGVSYFAKWLDMRKGWAIKIVDAVRDRISAPGGNESQVAAWAAMIAERPCCSSLLEGWQPDRWRAEAQFTKEHLPPVFEEALEYTAFGIDEFKRRADRDGARLIILSATKDMGRQGDPPFDYLSAIAEPLGIPVISDYDYIVRQGYGAGDGLWRSNAHWNAVGHRWAAEAILEWLKANQDVCD